MADPNHEIVVIAWYDGVIEALLPSANGKWKYASVIACSHENKLRIYGLVEANDAFVAEVRALSAKCRLERRATEESWSALRRRIMAFLQEPADRAEIRLCEDLNGEPKATKQVDAFEIVPLMGREIEENFDRERFEGLLTRFRDT